MSYYRSKGNFKLGDRVVDMNDPIAPHEVENSAGADRTLLGIGMMVEDPTAEDDYNKLFGGDDEPTGEDVDATPEARKLAEERGVDLTYIEPTGEDGQVLKSDVEFAPPEAYNATDTAIELARDEEVDLADVEGNGVGGKILKKDVEAFIRERDEGEDLDEEA